MVGGGCTPRRYSAGFLEATRERGLTLAQLYAACYALTQHVVLEPAPWSKKRQTTSVGSRQDFLCETCTDQQKTERGYCPFASEWKPGTVPSWIDTLDSLDTFNEEEKPVSHDCIYACPRGIQLDELYVREDVALWHRLTATGGAAAYYRDPLEESPPYVQSTLALLAGIESRFLSEVMRQRRDMDKR